MPYKPANVRDLKLGLTKLQDENAQTQKIWIELRELNSKQGLKEGWEEIDRALYRKGLAYIYVRSLEQS